MRRSHRDIEPIEKYHKEPQMVKVLVFETKTDKQIREWEVDLSNALKKRWMLSIILWATNNGNSVEVVHVLDDK